MWCHEWPKANPVLATAVDYGFDESFEFQAGPSDSTGIIYHLMHSLKQKKNIPF